MKCVNCNGVVRDDATICHYCGGDPRSPGTSPRNLDPGPSYGQTRPSPSAHRVEDIEIFADDQVGRPYTVLGPILARVTAGAAWNKARTLEDANSKLREVALRKGANAVINTTYERGVSMTSWKALTATGIAVVFESADKRCPFCAETIKREARVCRYCGRDLPPGT